MDPSSPPPSDPSPLRSNGKPSDAPLAVVGIGASAGGLAAIKDLFQHVPEGTGLAFVVVVHLSPEHKSHLADLLQASVRMPVEQVAETVPLRRDHVYVIPPGANLNSVDTHLRLSELEEDRRERAPIDHFFRTLAQTHDGNSVGVVLTGTGSDGTLGLREIKGKGGLTVVQDPNEAEYDGMPQSALATGMVDLVLPLAEIPEAVMRFVGTHPRVAVPEDDEDLESRERQLLQKVFAHVRARTGRDFSRYKRSTLTRRIRRRMQLVHVEDLAEYVDVLRKRPEEAEALADEFLITVTSFFRDREVFAELEANVIPKLFEGKGPEDPVRVWSVGCASGEEAYSLAMLLLEAAARCDAPPRLQVFATDLHEKALRLGREGLYAGDIEQDVPAERLERFFVRENGGYRVRKSVREMVVFAPHNVMGDPPFSRMDLISCRNMLIYLEREVQRDVMRLFHYALNPSGFLVVGTSETVDDSELFRPEDKKTCTYRKHNVTPNEPNLPVFPLTRTRVLGGRPYQEQPETPISYGGLHQRMVERLAPPSLLVNREQQVVHLSEQAGAYLVHPGGEPTANVFKLVREELRIELRAALHAAEREGRPVRAAPVRARIEGEPRSVALHVRPAGGGEFEGYYLVIFDEGGEEPPPAGGTGPPADATSHELEAELALVKQRLQAVIEEYETSQEEMRASNEELQSTNEELRSTMEELETSKEELQSMNEELTTLNQENRHKVDELGQLSADLQNLLTSTEIATLFLDRELRILRFTPPVGELFNVRVTDRGRPLSDLTHRLGYPELPDDARRVLERLIPIEREVQDEAGLTYLARALPYRSGDDRIEGVVLTFIDISGRVRAEEALEAEKVYAESIVETLHEPLLVLTPDLRVRSANRAFYDHFEVDRGGTEGQLIYRLGNGQWDIPELRTLLEDVLPDSNVFNDYEVSHDFDDLGHRVMLLNARRLDHVQLILLGIRDITERKRAEDSLRETEGRFRSLFEASLDAILLADDAGVYTHANPAAVELLGCPRDEILGKTIADFSDVDEAGFRAMWEAFLEEGRLRGEYRLRTAQGEVVDVDFNAVAHVRPGQHLSALRDVTERNRTAEALRESEGRYRTLFEAMDEAYAVVEVIRDEEGGWVDFRFLEVNPAFVGHTGMEPPAGRTAAELLGTPNPRWVEVFGRVAETGEPVRFEEVEPALGRVFDLYAFRLGESGSPRVAVLFTNVTARRELEDRQAFLLELGDALRPLADPAEVQSEAARVLGEHLGAGRAAYAEIDADDAHFTVHRDYTDGVPSFAGRHRLDSYGPEFWADLRAGRTISVADAERDARISEGERAPYAAGMVRAAIGVPLIKGGRLAAVFFLHFPVPHPWPAHEVALVEETAERTWAAIERARAEEALRESEARFRQMAEAVPDVVFTTSPEGTVDYVSPRREEMTGHPPENALGTRMWPELVHPDDRPRAEAQREGAYARQEPFEARYRLRLRDGTYRWFIVRARPILSADAVVRWFGTLTDVDDLSRAEREVQTLNAELEARVAERTEKVRELARALTLAEQQERHRIAHVLHDDLQQVLAGAKMRAGVAGTHTEARVQLLGILDHAIDLTRTLSMELAPPILQGEGLEEALLWLAGRERELHGLEVEVEVEPGCVLPNTALRVLLYQLLRELLFNVVKHAGTGRARVRAWREGDAVCVAIEDEGAGFDLGVAARGFGLHQVRERLELVGGRLRMESVPGEGTRATISLPLSGPTPP